MEGSSHIEIIALPKLLRCVVAEVRTQAEESDSKDGVRHRRPVDVGMLNLETHRLTVLAKKERRERQFVFTSYRRSLRRTLRGIAY